MFILDHMLMFYPVYRMGDNEDVDTSSFRQAIWYYIQCMFGIRHDDYNYSEINQLLERNLKSYVKTTTCFPERVTKKDYDSFMREFKHSEKVGCLVRKTFNKMNVLFAQHLVIIGVKFQL